MRFNTDIPSPWEIEEEKEHEQENPLPLPEAPPEKESQPNEPPAEERVVIIEL